jgi:hypothetical protein
MVSLNVLSSKKHALQKHDLRHSTSLSKIAITFPRFKKKQISRQHNFKRSNNPRAPLGIGLRLFASHRTPLHPLDWKQQDRTIFKKLACLIPLVAARLHASSLNNPVITSILSGSFLNTYMGLTSFCNHS